MSKSIGKFIYSAPLNEKAQRAAQAEIFASFLRDMAKDNFTNPFEELARMKTAAKNRLKQLEKELKN